MAEREGFEPPQVLPCHQLSGLYHYLALATLLKLAATRGFEPLLVLPTRGFQDRGIALLMLRSQIGTGLSPAVAELRLPLSGLRAVIVLNFCAYRSV